MAFENQVPSVASGTITVGNTTAAITLRAAAGAGIKNRIFLELMAVGAAAAVLIKSGSTTISPPIFFAAKDTRYLGVWFESAVNEDLTMNVTLDSAAPAAGVGNGASYRFDTK